MLVPRKGTLASPSHQPPPPPSFHPAVPPRLKGDGISQPRGAKACASPGGQRILQMFRGFGLGGFQEGCFFLWGATYYLWGFGEHLFGSLKHHHPPKNWAWLGLHEFNQVQALVAWGLKLAIRRPKEAKLSKSPSIYRSSVTLDLQW